MNFPSLKELTVKAKSAFARFPVTLLWSLLGSIFCITIIFDDSRLLFNEYNGIFLTLILGVSWFIGTRFLIEQFQNPKKWQWLKLITLALLIAFYFHLPDLKNHYGVDTYYIRFVLYFIGGHLFVLFAPFIIKWNAAAYWNYLKTMGVSIVRSGLFSGVLYLGLVLALLAIDALFEVHIKDNRFFQLFIFCLGVVNTWIYLSDFPKNVHQETKVYFHKAIEVFVKYILLPLVILYLIILYAYSIKIVFQWELPKGWVSYLVTALAILGFVVEMLMYPVQKMVQSRTMNRFHPWFYILLLPLIILLFVAIYRRISDYGITENRYFILVAAFWILGITLYMLISKKRQLKIISLSLFVIVVLSSFGPWGAFNISKNSQLKQFKKVYASVVQKGKVATGDEYNQLKSIIDYFGDLKAADVLDETIGFPMETYKDTSESKYRYYVYDMPEKTLDTLGIIVVPNDMDKILGVDNYYNYGVNNINSISFNIEEYDYFAPVYLTEYEDRAMEISDYKVHFSAKKNELKLINKTNDSLVLTMPLTNSFLKLKSKGNKRYEVDRSLLEVQKENDSISSKLFMKQISFRAKNDSIFSVYSEGYLFLKIK